MQTKYQEGLSRAEAIYQLKHRDRLENECPGRIVAIEIASERAFVADGVAEALQQALSAGVEEPLFVKRIGSLDRFVGFHPTANEDKLQSFLQGVAHAYTIRLSSRSSPFPGLVRKLDHDRLALVLFSSQDGATAFLEKLQSPDHVVVEVSLSDVQDFVRRYKQQAGKLVVEMLP